MIYGYIRVYPTSPDSQEKEMQAFADKKRFSIDEFFEENISAAKKLEDRKLSILLEKMQKGDKMVVSQLTHLGRSFTQIMEVLKICMNKETQLTIIDDCLEIGEKRNFEALNFAFKVSQNIDHKLSSLRSKERFLLQKSKGAVLGRPKGRLSKKNKLTGKQEEIQKYLNFAFPISNIARIFNVHRITMTKFILKNNLQIVFLKDLKRKK